MFMAINNDGAHFTGDIDNPEATFDDAIDVSTEVVEINPDEIPEAEAKTEAKEAPAPKVEHEDDEF